jgi:hypothetical protein
MSEMEVKVFAAVSLSLDEYNALTADRDRLARGCGR